MKLERLHNKTKRIIAVEKKACAEEAGKKGDN